MPRISSSERNLEHIAFLDRAHNKAILNDYLLALGDDLCNAQPAWKRLNALAKRGDQEAEQAVRHSEAAER